MAVQHTNRNSNLFRRQSFTFSLALGSHLTLQQPKPNELSIFIGMQPGHSQGTGRKMGVKAIGDRSHIKSSAWMRTASTIRSYFESPREAHTVELLITQALDTVGRDVGRTAREHNFGPTPQNNISVIVTTRVNRLMEKFNIRKKNTSHERMQNKLMCSD